MMRNIEITQIPHELREDSSSEAEAAVDVASTVLDTPARVDETGVELKRGAFLNTIAMLASNFRGIFTFLVARHEGNEARHLLARHDRARHYGAGAFDRAWLWIHTVRAGARRRMRNGGLGDCRPYTCCKTIQRCDCTRHSLDLDRSKTVAGV